MAAKNKAVKTPGWWLLRATFKNPDDGQLYSETIRGLPYPDRRWCRKINAWAIRRTQTEFVIDIAKRFLGLKVKA